MLGTAHAPIAAATTAQPHRASSDNNTGTTLTSSGAVSPASAPATTQPHNAPAEPYDKGAAAFVGADCLDFARPASFGGKQAFFDSPEGQAMRMRNVDLWRQIRQFRRD